MCRSGKKIFPKNHFPQQPKEPLETWLVPLHDNLTKINERQWGPLFQTLLQTALTAITTKTAEHKHQGQQPEKPTLPSQCCAAITTIYPKTFSLPSHFYCLVFLSSFIYTQLTSNMA